MFLRTWVTKTKHNSLRRKSDGIDIVAVVLCVLSTYVATKHIRHIFRFVRTRAKITIISCIVIYGMAEWSCMLFQFTEMATIRKHVQMPLAWPPMDVDERSIEFPRNKRVYEPGSSWSFFVHICVEYAHFTLTSCSRLEMKESQPNLCWSVSIAFRLFSDSNGFFSATTSTLIKMRVNGALLISRFGIKDATIKAKEPQSISRSICLFQLHLRLWSYRRRNRIIKQ